MRQRPAAAGAGGEDHPPFEVVDLEFPQQIALRRIQCSAREQGKWAVGYADGSAHRIISDLSAFIRSTDLATQRILAAGDLNMIYGATDDNPPVLPARDRTVTDRMNALGLEFLGPQHPQGGGAVQAGA